MPSFSEMFEGEPSQTHVQRSMRTILGICKSLNIPVDVVDYDIQTGFPMAETSKTGSIVLYSLYYKGRPISSIPPNHLIKFQPEKWRDFEYLGSLDSPRGALLPLALQQLGISGDFVEMTEQGLMYVRADSGVDVLRIQEMANHLRGSGAISYVAATREDAVLALEVILMLGGQLRTNPVSRSSQYQIIFQAPARYTLENLKRDILLIRSGSLPELSFTGVWSFIPRNDSVGSIFKRKAVVTTIATLAYIKLAERYPYLASLVYKVRVGPFHSVIAPIASYEQRILYESLLQEFYKKHPLSTWEVFPFENQEELILLRYYFERNGRITLAPAYQAGIGVQPDASLLVIESGETVPGQIELEEAKEEIINMLRDRKALPSPDRTEKRCLDTVGLERTLCCVDSGSCRYEVTDTDAAKEELTFMDKTRLALMDEGLRGYFEVSPLLGLYKDPPTNPSLPKKYKGTKAHHREKAFLRDILETKDGASIPMYQEEITEDLVQLWNQGILQTPWNLALHDYQGVVDTILAIEE